MRHGSFKLFEAFGISVFVHWSWFIVAAIFFQMQATSGGGWFDNPYWFLLLYVTLFGIVTLHEFGHALACLSVGGKANTIVLWPLGGIAFVQPPNRPGAVLWSIAAGPLVNLLLVPVTVALLLIFVLPVAPEQRTDAHTFLMAVTATNLILLIFNMLPIYPLDGGQIVQSLLWFVIGKARSLQVVSVIGLIAAVPLGLFMAFGMRSWIGVFIACFIAWQAYNGYRTAQLMVAYEKQTRHGGNDLHQLIQQHAEMMQRDMQQRGQGWPEQWKKVDSRDVTSHDEMDYTDTGDDDVTDQSDPWRTTRR